MKKIIMMTALGALLAAGFTSCKQNDEPKYKDPTTFTINTPALQNQLLETNDDMTNTETFNLFCSQPDYGYSAIANYSAIVSLDPSVPSTEADIEAGKSLILENMNPTSGAMAIKTYALAIAANKLAGISEEDQYEGSAFDKGPVTLYFRALCEIPGIESSRIVSSNVVTYNKVKVVYAVLKPGWIFICGDVTTVDGSHTQAFLAPAAANAAEYENFRLYEPVEQAGNKLYVGQFMLNPNENGADHSSPDNASSFRFFTELLGWTDTASLGSHTDDFYKEVITDAVSGGAMFQGDVVAKGLGNWAIHTTELLPLTIVVDVTGLNVYVEEGLHNVTFEGRTPKFE